MDKNKLLKIIVIFATVLVITLTFLPESAETEPVSTATQSIMPSVEPSAVPSATSEPTPSPSPTPDPYAKSASDEVIEDLSEAIDKNSDVRAWLTLPNTDIDSPIVQTDNNSHYLSHNAEGNYDQWGAYFADLYANLDTPESMTQNTVIYGHTSGTENPEHKRFSELFRYLDEDFLSENPYMYLSVGDIELTYEICAVFYSDIGFYYIDPAPAERDFNAFYEGIEKRNEYIFDGEPVSSDDKFLTLSCCSYTYDYNDTGNHRFVVMGKLVAEEREVSFTLNPDPLRPRA